MISGVTVDVYRPNVDAANSPDRLGNPVYTAPNKDTVDNVLVAEPTTDDLEAARPLGARVDLVLHFPKGYTGDLRGATVELPAPWAGEYRVVGRPLPLIDANTPTPWHMQVSVEAVDG